MRLLFLLAAILCVLAAMYFTGADNSFELEGVEKLLNERLLADRVLALICCAVILGLCAVAYPENRVCHSNILDDSF